MTVDDLFELVLSTNVALCAKMDRQPWTRENLKEDLDDRILEEYERVFSSFLSKFFPIKA